MYETLFEMGLNNFTDNLLKRLEKIESAWLHIRSGKSYQLFTSYLSIIFSGTV